MRVILLLLAIAGFAGLSRLVTQDRLRSFDEAIIHAIQSRENDTLTAAAKLFTKIGSTSVVIPVILITAVILFVVLKHRKELVLLIGGMLGQKLLNDLLKGVYQRARPDIHRIVEETGYSYPSGHSMASFTFYSLLAYLLWRHLPSRGWRAALIVFSVFMILGIGLSRVYLGVHYPSDILGGYWVSGCWVALCIMLFRRFGRTRPSW
jgi:undecaprenyl-diphosphatase